ncbi:GTPase HflX [bioreactor metagenome]|uniref:GTPase HflX n=1 Tax=bioreactor metagenome TaxID=1076179 RepID=A0A644YTS2_9ZZZZ|nr:GTPase HflX [Synergistales bacterium]
MQERKAVIAGLELPGQPFSPSVLLEEVELLLRNLGITSAGSVIQRRSRPDPAFLLGKGKAEELALFCKTLGATLLVCNESLTPGQKNNLQRTTGVEVWDRPFVIMKIFELRASSSEAKMQVEMALCKYEIPHLKGLGAQMSRLGGGIGTRGPGETEFERHRRKLERRVRDIGKKLGILKRKRTLQRDRRKKMNLPVVSLVGYTNSGKSSLLRALSGDASLVAENRLFSTLDTFMRKVRLPSGREILLSDTVGFIRDLPPGLVAAFRTTLEEIVSSSFLVFVLDAAAADFQEIREVVEKTVQEIGGGDIPRFFALNKCDLLAADTKRVMEEKFREAGEAAVFISALSGTGLSELLATLDAFLLKTETSSREGDGD